jgi:UDP-glucose 4-epimerase
MLGLKWLQEGNGSRIFNLGTGHGYSVREVIDKVQKVTKNLIEFTEGAKRPGDCAKLISGSTRANTELGWSPKRSNLKQMIADAWHWHQTGYYSK